MPACGIEFSDKESNPGPLNREHSQTLDGQGSPDVCFNVLLANNERKQARNKPDNCWIWVIGIWGFTVRFYFWLWLNFSWLKVGSYFRTPNQTNQNPSYLCLPCQKGSRSYFLLTDILVHLTALKLWEPLRTLSLSPSSPLQVSSSAPMSSITTQKGTFSPGLDLWAELQWIFLYAFPSKQHMLLWGYWADGAREFPNSRTDSQLTFPSLFHILGTTIVSRG